ncbi:hypothetical protein TWF569_009099 [Orbilia oligospora]|nr:hypothetical protein TWF706_005215 [Orbilia oligospora]KAF3138016.1 hypothetical protein TWF569_009099 [Orbilia oligospora]KAF3153231.1 hypothetical protein TWF594_000260 [Orbilia oligospora]
MVYSPLRTQVFDRLHHNLRYAITILAIIIISFISDTRGACYFPDGSLSNDLPCDPSASNSMCCSYGTDCLMNGVCHSYANTDKGYVSTYARGSCTDQSWGSSACLSECIYEGTYSQWGPLIPCSNNVDAFFCYFAERDNDGEHCEQRTDVFTLVGGNSIRTTIGVAVSTQVSTQISTIRSIETSIETTIKTSIATIFVTPSPSPSPTPDLPSVDTSLRSTPSNIISDSRSRTTSTDANTPTNVSSPASSSSGPNPVIVGGAVGGSIGALCLCLIAYLAYALGKRRQAERMTPSEPMWQLPHGPTQTQRHYPTNMPILPMAVHQYPHSPVSPRPALSPDSIPPPPAGGLPPGYTPYNAQSFGPPLT